MLVLIGRWGKEGRGRLSDLLCSAAFFLCNGIRWPAAFLSSHTFFQKGQHLAILQNINVVVLFHFWNNCLTCLSFPFILTSLNAKYNGMLWHLLGGAVIFLSSELFILANLYYSLACKPEFARVVIRGVKINDAKKETLLPQTIEIL